LLRGRLTTGEYGGWRRPPRRHYVDHRGGVARGRRRRGVAAGHDSVVALPVRYDVFCFPLITCCLASRPSGSDTVRCRANTASSPRPRYQPRPRPRLRPMQWTLVSTMLLTLVSRSIVPTQLSFFLSQGAHPAIAPTPPRSRRTLRVPMHYACLPTSHILIFRNAQCLTARPMELSPPRHAALPPYQLPAISTSPYTLPVRPAVY